MSQQEPFAERVALVTGGASGIGRALCQEFARQGAKVGVLDIDSEGALALARTLPNALALPCNITDAASCAAAVTTLVARYGRLDILVNNAGMSHHSEFADTDLTVIRRVMEVNFFGAVACTQAALPHIVRRHGSIVALSSVAGFAPLVGRTGYAASKHALHGFFGSLRAELRPHNVHVMVACPSYVRTDIDRNALAGDGSGHRGEKATAGRLLEPADVARVIAAGVVSRRELALISPVSKISHALFHVAPRVYERIMRKRSAANK